MVKIDAFGIIFPNAYDSLMPDLAHHRTVASIPFGARYRMIDFPLSGMANAGVENVVVLCKKNYYSLMDHVGNGREWDMSRKRGGLTIVPPFAHETNKVYHGRVEALSSILDYLASRKEKYAILNDCNVASDLNYVDLIKTHIKTGADVTMVYEKTEVPGPIQTDNHTLALDESGRVMQLFTNDYRSGVRNLSMNVIVIEREALMVLVKDAVVRGMVYFESDILATNLSILNVRGYEYDGYRARIYDMKSFFNENMRLIDPKNQQALFPEERPVYTKVRDEAPVRYGMDSAVKHSLLADGCIIEGTVENCVLFRGVKINKGAVVKNCVLMQGTIVEKGAHLDHIVTDKNVTITANRTMLGAVTYPVFVEKNTIV